MIGPLIAPLDHAETRQTVLAERAFLARLEGGCQVPIAGHATLSGKALTLTGLVAGLEGTPIIKETLTGPADQARAIGLKLAETLLDKGARANLDTLQTDMTP